MTETERNENLKKCFALSISTTHVLSKILTATYKISLGNTNLPLAIFLITCRTTAVMSTSAKGSYERMMSSESFQPTPEIIGTPLLAHSSSLTYQQILGKFSLPINIINSIVQSALAGYSSYVIILALCSSLPGAMIVGSLVFTVTMFISYYFGGHGIETTLNQFGSFLDRPEKNICPYTATLNILLAVTALTSLPLLYTSLYTPLITGLQLIGLASVANPIALTICAVLLTVSGIASIGINYSQGSKLSNALHKIYDTFIQLTDKRQKGAYITAFILATVISIASIVIAVMGDVFGLKQIFSFDIGMIATITFTLMSVICNTAFTLSDTLESVTSAFKYLIDLCTGNNTEKCDKQTQTLHGKNPHALFKHAKNLSSESTTSDDGEDCDTYRKVNYA